VSVPQFAAGFVGKIFVNDGDAGVPHVATICIAEQTPAFPEILVVRVNAAADVTVSGRPGARLDVNAFPDETERRTALEGFNYSVFCFFVENGPASEFTQSSKFQQQRGCFCRIRYGIPSLPGAEIDVNIRQPRRRIEDREQSVAQIFCQAQEAFVARQLIAGEKPTEQADRDLEVFDGNIAANDRSRTMSDCALVASASRCIRMSVSSASTGVIKSDPPYQSWAVLLKGCNAS